MLEQKERPDFPHSYNSRVAALGAEQKYNSGSDFFLPRFKEIITQFPYLFKINF